MCMCGILQACICRYWYFGAFRVACGGHAIPARFLAHIIAECWLLSVPADNAGAFKYFSARVDEPNNILHIGIVVAVHMESDCV